jgi:hypothetical protein
VCVQWRLRAHERSDHLASFQISAGKAGVAYAHARHIGTLQHRVRERCMVQVGAPEISIPEVLLRGIYAL